jgi:hypothetical protein
MESLQVARHDILQCFAYVFDRAHCFSPVRDYRTPITVSAYNPSAAPAH